MNGIKNNIVCFVSGRRFRLPGSLSVFLASLALCSLALTASSQIVSPFSLPLYFEANNDQTEFLSRGNGYQFLISSSGVQLALRDTGGPSTARMQFVGANPQAEIHGDGELAGKVNYFVGNDSSKWQTGLPTFSKVQLAGIYPGINAVFHGNQRQLEYDFDIAPGASPDVIKLHFGGVDGISIASDGELVLKIGSGDVVQPRPEIYQTVAGARTVIQGGYKMLDARTVAFQIGSYDHSLPLVVDPVLSYATYFGGSLGTVGYSIALNTNSIPGAPNGSIYIAGQTLSKHFFTTGAEQTNFGGGKLIGDAFVAKFSNPPTNLLYLTYLGGTNDDDAHGLAVDAAGDAFVTGFTDSTNFPTTNALYPKIASKFDPSFGNNPSSAFVAELNPNGSQLIYSTYLGGSYENYARAIAIDSSDNAYVVGYTSSTNFPFTANALQKSLLCTNDEFLNFNAFVTEIASNDASLVYSTYLGGTNSDVATSVAVDPNNYVYVAGYTDSTNFPVTPNALTNFPILTHLNGDTNRIHRDDFDAFVTKFPPLSTQPSNIAQLVYSTYLGGTNSDMANGIAADASGDAYVTGWTTSTNFPVFVPGTTNGPAGLFSFLTTNGLAFRPGVTNAFLTKISPDGSDILDSVVFGGNGEDIGYNVVVDSADNAFVVGAETSTNFPTTNTFDFLRATNTGGHDVFVTSFNSDWSALNYSVLMGGRQNDYGYGIALDSADDAFITGQTDSTNFPTGQGVFSFNGTNVINGTNFITGAKLSGTNDAFLAEILYSPSAPTISAITPTNNLTVGVGEFGDLSITVSNITTQLLFQWQLNGTNLINNKTFSGVTTTSLGVTNVQTNDSGTYTIVVNYGGGTVTTNATLFVAPYPLLNEFPQDQTNALGAAATFSVNALGVSPLHYQWQLNGTNLVNGTRIKGATTNTLTITNLMISDAGTYNVIVTNAFGSTNASATLTIVAAPQVITPLSNVVAGLGYTISFSVSAFGATPFHYHWQMNGNTLTNNAHIGGATNDTLILTNTTINDAGTYEVTVTNAFGSTNSSGTLTVLTAPRLTITAIDNHVPDGLIISGEGANATNAYALFATSNLLSGPITATWSNLVGGTVLSPGSFTVNVVLLNSFSYLRTWPQAFFVFVPTNSP